MARLEAEEVPPTVTEVVETTRGTIFERLGNALDKWSRNLNASMDRRNDIKLTLK